MTDETDPAILATLPPESLTPAQRIAVCTYPSHQAWERSGRPWPGYTRATMPVRVLTREQERLENGDSYSIDQ